VIRLRGVERNAATQAKVSKFGQAVLAVGVVLILKRHGLKRIWLTASGGGAKFRGARRFGSFHFTPLLAAYGLSSATEGGDHRPYCMWRPSGSERYSTRPAPGSEKHSTKLALGQRCLIPADFSSNLSKGASIERSLGKAEVRGLVRVPIAS
jgi:hypothetical protein